MKKKPAKKAAPKKAASKKKSTAAGAKDAKGRTTGKKGAPKFSNKGNIVGKNKKRKDIKNPEALAAFLGRKKMGGKAFSKKAAAGKKAAGGKKGGKK